MKIVRKKSILVETPVKVKQSTANILIADEAGMFAQGLKAMLMIRKYLGVPSIATSGGQALSMMRKEKFDLLIVALNLPDIPGLQFAGNVKKYFPHVKVLVVVLPDDQMAINEIIHSDVDGYVFKESAPDVFFTAIEHVLYHDPGSAEKK